MQKFPVWDDHSSCARPLIHSTTTPNPALARKLQSNTDPNVSYAGNTANIPGSAPSTTGGNDVRSCTSVERRYIPCDRQQLRINCTKHTHTISCASTSKTSDATRFRDAGVARRARAAPCRTRRIEPMMIAPTSTRFACRVAYVIFASVTRDGCGTNRRRVDARRSGRGVVGCEAGRKMFERDWAAGVSVREGTRVTRNVRLDSGICNKTPWRGA